MTVRQALALGEKTLREASVLDSKLDAEYLLCSVLNTERFAMLLCEGGTQLSEEQEQRYRLLLLSRSEGEPLQYLLGETEFYGYRLKTDRRALIPRPETELLCETGIHFLNGLSSERKAGCEALDLCTGSGAIAIVLKKKCPFARVSAGDISSEAISLAKENAALHQAEICMETGDLTEPFHGMMFDLILSNPPYIPADDCGRLQREVLREPVLALDGGPDGLTFYRRIASRAPKHLKPGGMLAVEIGSEQGRSVAELFKKNGLLFVSVRKDLAGSDRMVLGYVPDEEKE